MTGSISGKIDRYYQKLLEEREREKAKNKPLIEETDVVEFFEKRLGFKATAYQEKLLRDKSQFILARWSRQSGSRGSEPAAEPEDDRQDLPTRV